MLTFILNVSFLRERVREFTYTIYWSTLSKVQNLWCEDKLVPQFGDNLCILYTILYTFTIKTMPFVKHIDVYNFYLVFFRSEFLIVYFVIVYVVNFPELSFFFKLCYYLYL